MPECPICHCSSPNEDGTGYRGDDICPSCGSEGWTLGADGTLFNEREDDTDDEYEAIR